MTAAVVGQIIPALPVMYRLLSLVGQAGARHGFDAFAAGDELAIQLVDSSPEFQQA